MWRKEGYVNRKSIDKWNLPEDNIAGTSPVATCNVITTNGISPSIVAVYVVIRSNLLGFAISFVPIFPDLFTLSVFTVWELAQPTL